MPDPFPLLAIDPGRLTGWAAIAGPEDEVESGTVEMIGANTGAKMLSARLRFYNMIDHYQPALLYIEDGFVPKHMDKNSTMMLFGYRCILEMEAHKAGIPLRALKPSTIKHQVAGKGSADKAQMMAAVRFLGYDPKDDNEADSLALLECAMWKECPRLWSARDSKRVFKVG